MTFLIYDTTSGSQRSVSVWKMEAIIGSDAGCDVVLCGDAVAARHARFYRHGHHRFLDVFEGASVETGYGRIEDQCPPKKYKLEEVGAGDYCRIDRYPFKVGQYIIQEGR